VKTELEVVPQLLIEAGSATDTPLDTVKPKRPGDIAPTPSLLEDETDGKS